MTGIWGKNDSWTCRILSVSIKLIALDSSACGCKDLAKVAELADALDSKSSVLNRRVGSIPTFGTVRMTKNLVFAFPGFFIPLSSQNDFRLYANHQSIGSKKSRCSAQGNKEPCA